MKCNRLGFRLMIIMIVSLFLGIVSGEAKAQGQYGYCTDLKLEDIPHGDFSSFAWPQQKPDGTPIFRVTQVYNQPAAEKWCDPSSGACFWGHDGIDVHESPSVGPNVNYNIALQNGRVIAAMWGKQHKGWGYRITIASRIPYSHQIITFNYAHMEPNSLLFGFCDDVQQGDRIGLEGNTGWGTGAHLHLAVRIWDSIDQLNAALFLDDIVKRGDSGGGLFQNGYVYNSISRLANYLSPYHLITDKFLEFECNDPECPTWAKPHALAARRAGIDFGRFDGYFALDTNGLEGDVVELLKRGESARWFKVARKFVTDKTTQATFTDAQEDSIDFPYIATLVKNGVLSPNTDCNQHDAGKQWCSNLNRTRAELLKMLVETFMQSEYNAWYMQALMGKHTALFTGVVNGNHFQDLYDPATNSLHWATSYVLFVAFNGTIPPDVRPIDIALDFRPEDPVDKLEAVKMLMIAREWYFEKYGHESQYNLCDYHYCDISEKCVVLPEDGYEGPYYATCIPLPSCVPEEGGRDDCNYGGGINPDPCTTNPTCIPNQTQTQPCGNGGTQTSICTSECQWGAWGDCIGSGACQNGQTQSCGNCGTMTCVNNQWGACQNEGICTPGQTEQQVCNGTGTQSRTCGVTCQWGGWSQCSVQPVCTPGQTQEQTCTTGGNPGTQTRTCNSSGQWGSWGTCIPDCECNSGTCCDGCFYHSSSYVCDDWREYRCQGSSPGQDAQYMEVEQHCTGYSTSCTGHYTDSGWLTYDNCSSSEECVMNGSTPQCVSSCTDTYVASTSQSCSSSNPNNVEICLQLQQSSGATWKYRLCKGSGTFQNNVDYEIIDIKHSSQYLHSGTGGQGSSCTPWKNINMSYITGYGSSNGATLRGQLYSPSGCTQAQCFFRSSLITLNLECQ